MKNPKHLRHDQPDQPVILVADDDVMILNIVRITLERNGYFVLAAENGEEALLLSRRFPGEIHMLLTDVCMPKMNGIQAAQKIMTERPAIAVLLMSGSFDEENPGFPLVHKPFSPLKLSEAVKRILPPRRGIPARVPADPASLR